ncbi:MAG: polysaccharide deacetylase family protein [Eubacterium sp.]|nr:polysaccharide deacetylase family protein [Eubacterium sp.]
MKRTLSFLLTLVILLAQCGTAFAQTAPPKTGITSLTACVESVKVRWEVKACDGYQLLYSRTKAFKKHKLITVKNGERKYKRVRNLKPNQKYYFKIRTYKLVDGKKVKSDWSKVKTVKPKAYPKMIALTFDDGPGYNDVSERILDVLEKYGVKATFFMVGKNAADHPKNLERKLALGCELGNHTQTHEHYGKNVTRSDIQKCTKSIKKACGKKPSSFRSPGGSTTSLIRDECLDEGMPLYFWSIDTLDWKYRDADRVYNAVMNNVKDGDIILMHELYSSTADAVERMVPKLLKKGYRLVTCEELILAKTGKLPEAGVQYISAYKTN